MYNLKLTDVRNCRAKKTYKTMNQARMFSSLVNKHFKEEKIPKKVSPYKCPVCGLYHLTSSSKRTQEAFKRFKREQQNDRYEKELKNLSKKVFTF